MVGGAVHKHYLTTKGTLPARLRVLGLHEDAVHAHDPISKMVQILHDDWLCGSLRYKFCRLSRRDRPRFLYLANRKQLRG
jgi:hypothetical protein